MENKFSNLFHNYFSAFLHPFKNQEELRRLREEAQELSGTRHLRLADSDIPTTDELVERQTLRSEEILSISWIFAAIEALYGVFTIYLGNMFFQSWDSPQELALLLPLNTTLYTQKALLSATLGKVVFFPLIFWVWAGSWRILIQFFANLFQVEGDVYKMSRQVVQQSMTSHVLLAIPIFGRMLRHLAGFVHLFAGLRRNMQMSVLQSVIVIVSPAIIMTMATSLFMVTALYLISLVF